MAYVGTAYTAMAYNSHGLISYGRLQDLCTSAQEEPTLLAEPLKHIVMAFIVMAYIVMA